MFSFQKANVMCVGVEISQILFQFNYLVEKAIAWRLNDTIIESDKLAKDHSS